MRAPTGVAASDFGLFVSDTGNTRLQRFSRAGVLLETWSTSGDQPNQVRGPAGLSTDGATLWVAESGGDRIQSFTPQVEAAPPIPCGSDPTLCIP